jgi:DNA polymerase family B
MPTVCTLMGLWRWVIAKGVDWRDSTEETRALLERITLNDLQRAEMWRNLATLVQVLPDGEILPLRAKYSGEAQYTIGLNRVTGDQPLWYALADCIDSKILSGRTPKILKALTFEPRIVQAGLRPVNVAGDPAYRVDSRSGDFYKTIIELRATIKARMKNCDPLEREALESQQLALKILANSTAYGIFV